MSKRLLVVAALIVWIAAAKALYNDKKTADKDFLLKQKKIYNLFYHVPQPDVVNPEYFKLGQAWNIEEKIDLYTNKDAAKEFLKVYQHGMLPRGEVFSIYYPKLLKESVALFRVFYYAKDFDTFFNTALWARIYINEGTYLCALWQAILNRPDTAYLQLPPPYEFYPQAFFNSEVLEKAKNAHFYREIKSTPDSDGTNSIIINANYSGWYIGRDYDAERKLNYFVEDIGMNAYYFHFRQTYPFWLNSKDYGFTGKTRGEEYIFDHRLILRRYNLERMANGLDAIEDFDWNSEFYPGYYPTMSYHNGLPFPQRPHWSKIPHYKYKYTKAIQAMELRVDAAIDLGYVIGADGKQVKIYTPEGLNILGNIIEGNEDSCNKDFYGSIDTVGRKILGYNLEPKSCYQIVPSALESFASCMRDPAFYRLYKRIDHFYTRYVSHLKPYTKEEVVYPELKIESVDVDKLLTYFDDFDTTISNGLLVANQKEADTFMVKVRQQRLNHKPFGVHLAINAEKATKVAIQIFLGPKHEGKEGRPLDFTESHKYFYPIDYWVTDLSAGVNKLKRNCHDFYYTYDDPLPTEVLYRTVERALEGGDPFTYQERIYGFPQRLILPKGRRAGAKLQMFIYVKPIVETVKYESRIWGSYFFDKRPFGFPLDRPIENVDFTGPNIYFKDVTIYHKYDLDVNATL